MFNSLRSRFSLPEGWQSSLSPKLKLILLIAVAVIGAALLIWIFDKVFLYIFARSYVEEIASGLGLNRHLATVFVWVVFAIATFFIGCILSFSKERRRRGIAGLFLLAVTPPGILYWANKPFDGKGNAQKCYVITRDSIRYGEREGIDPNTGLDCKPLTPDIAERVEKYANGNRPKRIETKDPVFFDLRTGHPIVWFARNKSGVVEIFDLMGFHPDTGNELSPITKELVEAWRDQNRQAPERVYPDENFAFFDPVTGKPTAWHRKTETGEYEFYSRPGFNPRTGEALLVVDRDTISEWKKYVSDNSKQCYVLTKNSVRYGSKPGIDSETGRQCRPFSAEMLERLREYEKGNRPKRIEAADPTFFDLRSGEPAIWYAKNKDGKIELFSLMGFHSESGEELLPITKDVVTDWKEQQAKLASRVPQKVDPSNFVFFGQINGEPRAWFWRGPDGQYEFYDGPGFQPRTGDRLAVLTKELVLQFQKDAADQTKRRETEQAAAAKTATDAADKRRDDLQKLSQAERSCDQMAANPNDKNKKGEGVPYDALKVRAKEALEACEIAVQQNLNEPRLQYQLARVLQLSDRKRAFSILQKLILQKYPAAFDNFGWMAYSDRKNPQEAVAYFRMGVDLADTDSMVSLAEMVDRGHAEPRGPSETKLALYRRAAQLGNQIAARAAEVEQQKTNVADANQMQQLQQQRMAMEVFGQILQTIPRR